MTDEMRDDLSSGDVRDDAEVLDEEVVIVREQRVRVDPRNVLEGVLPDATAEPYSTARPDFARGQEYDPASPERLVEDRFGRGQEEDPTLHEQVHEGDFATGQVPTPRHTEAELHGRFARGQQGSDEGDPNED